MPSFKYFVIISHVCFHSAFFSSSPFFSTFHAEASRCPFLGSELFWWLYFCNHHITRTPRRDIIQKKQWRWLLNHHRRRKTTSTPPLRYPRNLHKTLLAKNISKKKRERYKKKRTVTALFQEEAQDEVCNHELNSYNQYNLFYIIASSRRRSGGHASHIARALLTVRERYKNTPSGIKKKREKKKKKKKKKNRGGSECKLNHRSRAPERANSLA